MKKWNVYYGKLKATARGETVLEAISDFYEMRGYKDIVKIEEKEKVLDVIPDTIPLSCDNIRNIQTMLKRFDKPDTVKAIEKELDKIRAINADLRAFGSENYLKVQELTK